MTTREEVVPVQDKATASSSPSRTASRVEDRRSDERRGLQNDRRLG